MNYDDGNDDEDFKFDPIDSLKKAVYEGESRLTQNQLTQLLTNTPISIVESPHKQPV